MDSNPGLHLGDDNTKREMIEQIRSDYKILLAAFSSDGKLNILFQNVDEENRFKEEYHNSLNFIKILTKGCIRAHWVERKEGNEVNE